MKKSERPLFSHNDLSVVCPKKMQWSEMKTVDEDKRFCEGCDKVLVDVTGYSKEEVRALQKRDPSICVAIKRTLVATSLLLSLAACSSSEAERPVLESLQDEQEDVEVYEVEIGMPVYDEDDKLE